MTGPTMVTLNAGGGSVPARPFKEQRLLLGQIGPRVWNAHFPQTSPQ